MHYEHINTWSINFFHKLSRPLALLLLSLFFIFKYVMPFLQVAHINIFFFKYQSIDLHTKITCLKFLVIGNWDFKI